MTLRPVGRTGERPDEQPRGEWVVPASFGQERIWLASQLDPESPAYNIVAPVPLPYDVTDADIVSALGEVVRRHEALRTSLRSDDGSLFQVVHATVPVDVTVTDLSALDPDERRRRLRQLDADDASAPLRPDVAPLWRARLNKLATAHWELVLVVHHSIFDAGSLAVLTAEVDELCRAALERRPPKLPELDVQSADYAAWQREQLSGPALAGEMAFWRERLAGLPLVHGVPTDRPRPATPSDAGGVVTFGVDPAVSGAVDDLARRLRATPFMVLMAAFTALLARLWVSPTSSWECRWPAVTSPSSNL